MKKKLKTFNPMKADLRTPKYQKRVVVSKKLYSRKKKTV